MHVILKKQFHHFGKGVSRIFKIAFPFLIKDYFIKPTPVEFEI